MNIFQDLFQKVLVVITSIMVGVTGVFTGQKPLPTPTPSPIVEQHSNPSPTPSITPSIKPTLQPTPKPSGTPKVEPTPSNQSKWTFTKDQYEVSISNVDYGTISRQAPGVMADVKIKNISITPFITSYDLSDCKVVKNGTPSKFYPKGPLPSLPKGIPPGESYQTRIEKGFSGTDYDASGNKILPSSDLKVTTCTFIVQTQDNSSIEPKVVTFSTL
ncbi:hypothetical protein A3C59_04990 [Candidatus Daviesbacteria bacterium RIFCSPHIGHO2_02_FULL_36_13]|uniref:Uncharacterized protein n=1 Tax=Candidatus Daviesbacteria bacterium RIFCSPHIGHO2_02_FULL_36_13 TaxID=1797768 RepID=A0A1F5JYQ8_9BACT|nr:MAG: hypothetical protein A3C59_04990 [Candidatus Daviesbacteria bacterium RIFCSPHIGHO2_02_FULL_36_13]